MDSARQDSNSDSLRLITNRYFGIVDNTWNPTALSALENGWNCVNFGGTPQAVIDDIASGMNSARLVAVSPNLVQLKTSK
ncbi:hypothetical protein ABH945_003746 [Paraburkholderia sp. GAS333]